MAKAARPTPSIIGRRYIIHERLGTGGMGAVYRATDRLTGNQVALKSVTLPAEQLLFSSRAGSTDLHLALAQEFRTLASLRHPNIISVLDYGFDEKINPYFTMNFLENAQTILEAGRGASLTTQIGYLIQTLQALSYLHRRGVLHRDLKPENVLIVNGGVKVLDFGLSVHTELDRARVDDSMVGTVAYMAPEFVRDREVSKSTDLYSVGVVAYELLSGRHPFDTSDMAILFDEIMNKPAPVSSIGMEDELTEVLSRLLTKSPEERYWDANKVIRDICDATSRPLPPETVEIRESFLQAARFVGRDKELAQLKEALDAAIVGNGSTWLIGGESGVGKSRLTEELRTLALVKGALVLRGQAVSEGGSPYSLWRDIIKRLVITTELKEEEASVLKPYIPHISDLLGYAVADPPPLDPLATQHRLFKTIAEVLSRQCKLQPVVLILEDLQWIESNSLAILDRLSSQVPNSSLLIIGNYRDDERPHLPDELPGMERLKLKRLTDEGITELSSSMLGKAGCSKQVVSLLQRETEGNPFFLVETVHTLAEEAGQIDDIATMTLPEKVFSGGVQEVVQRRLNRVPSNARPLLQLAAVAGRELDLSVLRELAPEEDIDIWLTTGADSAVLEAQGEMWRFSHDKLRAGVLDALSDDTRPILHRSVAEAIEKVHPDSLEHVAALAFLWGVAGDYGKEFHYSKLAGEQAVTNSANVEAINYFKRALALIAILLKPPDRPQAELELQARLAVPLLAAKGWGSPELEGVVARARELCQQVGETPLLFHALFFTCAFYFSRAEFQTAKEIGEQLLTMAETSGDPGMVMAANWGVGEAMFYMGDFASALSHFEQGISLYDPTQHHSLAFIYGQDPGAQFLSWSSWALCMMGYPDRARKRVEEAIALTEELAHPLSIVCAHFYDSMLQIMCRDAKKTLECAETCISLAIEHGFPLFQLWGTSCRGVALIDKAYIEEGLAQVHQGLTGMRAIGFETGVSQWLTIMGKAQSEMGQTEEGFKLLSEAFAFIDKTRERNYEAECHRIKGELLLSQKRESEAEDCFFKAIEVARHQHARLFELRVTVSLCRLWRKKGWTEEALQMLGEIYSWFTEGFDTTDLKEAKALLDELQ